jgi:hypothetical protein
LFDKSVFEGEAADHVTNGGLLNLNEDRPRLYEIAGDAAKACHTAGKDAYVFVSCLLAAVSAL